MEDWRVGEQINWSHYVAVCYLRLRSSRESERLQMKPESELCEMAPAPKDSWAEHSSQSYQITQPHLFSEEADRRNDCYAMMLPLSSHWLLMLHAAIIMYSMAYVQRICIVPKTGKTTCLSKKLTVNEPKESPASCSGTTLLCRHAQPL